MKSELLSLSSIVPSLAREHDPNILTPARCVLNMSNSRVGESPASLARLYLAGIPQNNVVFLQEVEPKFPTVVPVRDFDSIRDAARIDAAIKTKGLECMMVVHRPRHMCLGTLY